jgi:hypothetical protein
MNTWSIGIQYQFNSSSAHLISCSLSTWWRCPRVLLWRELLPPQAVMATMVALASYSGSTTNPLALFFALAPPPPPPSPQTTFFLDKTNLTVQSQLSFFHAHVWYWISCKIHKKKGCTTLRSQVTLLYTSLPSLQANWELFEFIWYLRECDCVQDPKNWL